MTHNEYSSSKAYADRIRFLLRDAGERLNPGAYARFAEQFKSGLDRGNKAIADYEGNQARTAVQQALSVVIINSLPMLARSQVWNAAFFSGSGMTPIGGVVSASGQISNDLRIANWGIPASVQAECCA